MITFRRFITEMTYRTDPDRFPLMDRVSRRGFAVLVGLVTIARPLPASVQLPNCIVIGGPGGPCEDGGGPWACDENGCAVGCEPVEECFGDNCWTLNGSTCCDCACGDGDWSCYCESSPQ